ncbi:MAG: fumarylacetoacetate hydrolase family protein [Burkholderiales bacterium]|nr:fumarylacetoacetate hydrolase family protein [Burkholderiales bacterium]
MVSLVAAGRRALAAASDAAARAKSAIPLHAGVTERLDWEVELGVVVGPGGSGITEAGAMKHVFGYTVVNDVSAREVQRRHGQQWFKGKSLDGTCPMDPWIFCATRSAADAPPVAATSPAGASIPGAPRPRICARPCGQYARPRRVRALPPRSRPSSSSCTRRGTPAPSRRRAARPS